MIGLLVQKIASFSTHSRKLLAPQFKLRGNSSLSVAETSWYLVSGFTRWASRKDIEQFTTDMNPITLDPVLDNQLLPKGGWVLELDDKVKYESLKVSLKDFCSPRQFNVFLLTTGEMEKLERASKHGISRHTVRIWNVHEELRLESLKFLLRDYKITRWGIKNNYPNEYFIELETPEEAERLIQEKWLTNVLGKDMQMIWYSC